MRLLVLGAQFREIVGAMDRGATKRWPRPVTVAVVVAPSNFRSAASCTLKLHS